ncbi:tight adherence protein B [Kitasatospora sp. GAS204A]|uniref:type II secretion system F family protein n=1 Tax=unclassified Kitasatospora TaxID=2633591 RepID=UPI00247713C9|nr:type II secretion system F family protein [Kitasatospora sp. GAS204B]MDH6119272.1 tight adherence protein B [Kitasatospora sp. GAS204B]
MTGLQLRLALAVLLCAMAAMAWARLDRRTFLRRRSRAVLEHSGGSGVLVRIGVRRLRRLLAPGAPRPRWLVPELLLLPCGSVAGYGLHSPVPPVVAVLLVFPSCRWRERRRAVRLERGRATAVIELCAALVGELRSGATPEQALDSVTGPGRATAGLLERLGEEAVARLVAGRYGADVPAALRWLATLPGGGGGSAIAACWQVTADSGTGLALALEQVAEALRADRALREEVRSELAGPRTTAVLLAALPVFGLLLGAALGAQPLGILLHTPLGWGCLAVGAALEVAGLCWSGRIVRGALADLGVDAGAVVRPGGRRLGPDGARGARRQPAGAGRLGGPSSTGGRAAGRRVSCRSGAGGRGGRTSLAGRRRRSYRRTPLAGSSSGSAWWRRECLRQLGCASGQPGHSGRHGVLGSALGTS